MNNINIVDSILYLFPNAKPLIDFCVEDFGEGQYIARWNIENTEQPTIEYLKDIYTEVIKEKEKQKKLKEIQQRFVDAREQQFTTDYLDGFYVKASWSDTYSKLRNSLEKKDLLTCNIRCATKTRSVEVDTETINKYCRAIAQKENELYMQKHLEEGMLNV